MLWMILHFLQPRCWEEGRGKWQQQEAQNQGDRRWGMGGRGQAGEDGWGAGGSVSAKGELNSRLNGNWVANGPKRSSCVCYQKPCHGQMSALAAYRSWQHLPCCCRCLCCRGHQPPSCSGHLNILPTPGAHHCFPLHSCQGLSPERPWDWHLSPPASNSLESLCSSSFREHAQNLSPVKQRNADIAHLKTHTSKDMSIIL